MTFAAFSLEAHLAYTHHFAVTEIGDLAEDELVQLHRDEHQQGYRAHFHEALDWDDS